MCVRTRAAGLAGWSGFARIGGRSPGRCPYSHKVGWRREVPVPAA